MLMIRTWRAATGKVAESGLLFWDSGFIWHRGLKKIFPYLTVPFRSLPYLGHCPALPPEAEGQLRG